MCVLSFTRGFRLRPSGYAETDPPVTKDSIAPNGGWMVPATYGHPPMAQPPPRPADASSKLWHGEPPAYGQKQRELPRPRYPKRTSLLLLPPPPCLSNKFTIPPIARDFAFNYYKTIKSETGIFRFPPALSNQLLNYMKKTFKCSRIYRAAGGLMLAWMQEGGIAFK